MEIAYITALTALVAVFFGPLVSMDIANKQIRATTVSVNRQAWINELRSQLAQLVTIIFSIAMETQKIEGISISKIDELHLIENKIRLMLNPEEEDHIELIALSDKLVTETTKTGDDLNIPHIMDLRDSIISSSQRILKQEWIRVKKGQ